jgi:hypothetical protein
MKNILYILTISLLIATGCSKESELNDSIYIPDPDYSNLPAYTEWGYNTFGVIWERKYFTYSTDEIPLKIIKNDSTISLLFQGHNPYDYSYGNYMALRFTFNDPQIIEYTDFLAYNDHIIDFIDDDVKVEITLGDTEELQILDGEIHFKRAQRLLVDDEQEQIILSGTFSLKFLQNSVPESMTNGRFDFGINDDIFYDLSGSRD